MDRTVSSQTLVLLAEELDRARDMIDGLANSMSGFVSACQPAERQAVLIRCQAIDALDQHLDALGGFIRDLSAGRALGSAAAAVPLAELAGRLGGRPAAADTPAARSGDLELFD